MIGKRQLTQVWLPARVECPLSINQPSERFQCAVLLVGKLQFIRSICLFHLSLFMDELPPCKA